MPRHNSMLRLAAGPLLAALVALGLTGCYRHVVGGASGDSTVYEPNIKDPDRNVTPLGPVKK